MNIQILKISLKSSFIPLHFKFKYLIKGNSDLNDFKFRQQGEPHPPGLKSILPDLIINFSSFLNQGRLRVFNLCT